MEHLNMGTVSMWLFFAVLVLGLGIFMYVAYYRLQILTLGQPDNRFGQLGKRIFNTIKIAFLQYKMPQEVIPGLLHIMVFGGFMVLGLRTVIIFGQGFGGSAFSLYSIPVIGAVIGPLYAVAKELVVLGVLIGVVGFAWRRLISKPTRMQNIVVWEPVLILSWIAGLMIADMLLESGLHASGVHETGIFTAPSLGWIFAPMLTAESGQILWEAMVWVHSVMILVFLNYLPFGKHFHIITAIPNVFFSRLESPGHMRKLEDLEDKIEQMEDDPNVVVGYENVEQYTWKEILDLYTCTECGRCMPQCPAWVTDKPLSLKKVNSESKHHLYERAPFLLGKKTGPDGKEMEYEGEPTCGGVISAETIWACTLCRDCEERCPVMIEQLPRIIELRRRLVMIEGDMPQELNNTFRGWERNSNPWGLGSDKRGDWITEEVPVPLYSENPDAEYLLYVGCMGSFDIRSMKIANAMCKILNHAGVNYAVLGEEEQCCGETARRLGNEFLGQIMIDVNVEIFKAYNVKKVIAFCPHCFNTLKNEYSDFDMEFDEVWHAADFVNKLVDDGKLNIKANGLGNVAYHDSCMLGRYNDIYESPRELLEKAGATVVDPELSRSTSFCCGAGGGRMWMEEEQPRVNEIRFENIMKDTSNPSLIGVSCPYCMTMITDGSKAKDMEDDVKVRDVIEIIADHLDG